MGRVARVDVADQVYHVINRAVGRLQIFTADQDYKLFEDLLLEAQDLTDMRILAHTLMPNHWHLQLYPRQNGDLGTFMHWLTNAHTRRVHSITKTVGTGPLYQGRYKSFLTQSDQHLLAVFKYVERNPVRARLVGRVEEWRWGSAWIRQHGTARQKRLLAESPVTLPEEYLAWVNTPDNEADLLEIRKSVQKGAPFGRKAWVEQMIGAHGLEATVRGKGRPSNGK